MFEFVPLLRGKYFTYTEYLFILTLVGFTILPSIFFSIGMLLNYLHKIKTRSAKYQSPESSGDEYYDSRSQSETLSPTFKSISSEKQMLNPKPEPAGTPAGTFFNYVGWLFVTHWPGAFATFHFVLPMWFAFILDYSFFALRIRHRKKMDKLRLYRSLQSKDKTEAYGRKVQPLNSYYRKLMIFFTIFDIFLHFLFTGFCVSSYQDYVGPIFGSASLSSSFSRYFQLSEFCPPGPPCHVYATLPEDTARSVFINVHTHESYDVIGIEYELDHSYDTDRDLKSQNSTSFKVKGTDRIGRRRLHHFYLDNLVPDSMYKLRIVYDGKVQHRAFYRTLPGQESPRDVILVQGGDMGNTKATRDVTRATIAMNPDVLVLGGDLAYDNGMCECYFAWDYFLKDLDQVNEGLGRLVPVIYSLGNHDAGIDEMNKRGGLKITEEGPFYMTYFPQHSKLSTRTKNAILPEVPQFDERKSYHYHKIGKLLLITLDSGYYADFKEQALWMEEILKDHLSYVKIALYHCPIYYACQNIALKNHEVIDAQRKEWMPVFDDNKFILAFENHEHYMKRTLPLKADKYDSQGIVYVGNGQWGTYDSKNCKLHNETGVYESIQEVYHYWTVNVSFNGGVVTNTPYDQDNNMLLPTGVQKIEHYVMEDIKY